MSLPIAGLSGLARLGAGGSDQPLVVAVHGGTYTSRYFDLPGHSLLDRAEANGIPVVAIDRPGHGGTPVQPPERSTIPEQAAFLTGLLHESEAVRSGRWKGIVLIGHSIGAAIAACIAAAPGDLPLLGLAMSGVGMRTPADHKPMWEALPPLVHVELPAPVKDEVMFGPEGSFEPGAPAILHQADAPALRAELVDIVSTWHERAGDVLGRIRVPVHYRQGEYDRLWIVDQQEVDDFEAALSASPRVDAALMRGTGHCMDVHKVGAAFQLQQLGFALQCAAEA